tara:strand:+ start:74699 stop:75136 length:438 start_codon:yes stop_codon:yes gene_type:complete
MARSKTGLRGVGKPSGEVPAEPVGEFGPGNVGHPVIPAKAGIWLKRSARLEEIPAFAGMTDMGHLAVSRSVVITAGILLAERCLKAGATVLRQDGKSFDAASIGSPLYTIGPPARTWNTCAPGWTAWEAARRRSARRTGCGSCRR